MLCRASCPEKTIYKEPDTAIPLKCDFCGEPPDPECVKWCAAEALVRWMRFRHRVRAIRIPFLHGHSDEKGGGERDAVLVWRLLADS